MGKSVNHGMAVAGPYSIVYPTAPAPHHCFYRPNVLPDAYNSVMALNAHYGDGSNVNKNNNMITIS